jgi:hypothetical protein
MDFKLVDGDMQIIDGEVQFIEGPDAIGQDIEMALGTWLGETVYDVTTGVPYLQVIFAAKNPDLSSIKFILENIVRRRGGVINAELTPTLDSETRVLTVTGTADIIDGSVDFSVIIEASP